MWATVLLVVEALGIATMLWVLCALACRLSASEGSDMLPFPGAAARRASALLRDTLEEREYEQLTTRGFLDVASPSVARRIYRIPRHSGMVTVYENGRAVRDLCLQPAERLPSGDVVLLHKLLIQASEEDYLSQANQFPARFVGQRYRS